MGKLFKENKEYFLGKLTEIIDENDRGGFNDYSNPPSNISYGHLIALLQMRGEMDGIDELFFSLYDYAINAGKSTIINKMRNREKIRIYFLLYTASEWSADSLYKLLKKDERFEVKILLVPLVDREENDMIHAYRGSRKFFLQNNYDLIDSFDEANMSIMKWDEMGGLPDIMIHLSSWNTSIPEYYSISNLPLYVLNCYVPYTFSNLESLDGTYMKMAVFDPPFMNVMWKIFMMFKNDKEEYEQNSYQQGRNVMITGYPKVDPLLFKREYTDDDIRELWKIPDGKQPNEMKKIIVTPHYSILNSGAFPLATFHKNAYFLLYLAEKNKDRVSFVFKPHPNLRMYAVKERFFESYEKYDEYIAAWNALPNAKVVDEAIYTDYFATSDGCINDSSSMMVEYLFTGKPMLQLKGGELRLRSYYNGIRKYIYWVDGGDYKAIEDFVSNTVINGNDILADDRKKMFHGVFEYDTSNPAALAIYKVLTGLLEE